MPSGAFRKKKTSYAQVSNFALRDKELSLKAKGLLSLIESYINLDNFVLYKQFLINKSKDGETSFRGAWKELKDNGYLIQYKMQDKETMQFYYEYEICDNPHVENPHVASPLVESLDGGKPIHRETHSYNKDLSNNTLNSNTLYTNIIQTNIDYNPVFVGSLDKELVDNIVNVMVDILVNNYECIKINNGEIKSEYLKSILLKVNMNHIVYTIDAIKNYKGKIANMRNFILSVLYNSVLTLDTHYQNLVHM